MTYSDRQRRVLTYVLFSALGVILLLGAFAPAYLAGIQRQQVLTLQCQNARFNVDQLEATRLVLRGEAAIAHDLGLPVAHDIDEALASYVIPEVPAECDSS